ncbi:TetR/AcrR family transcriptional regulator [Actinomyces lilanjuaniae]|uniref:TetR/AcrR family transcriptional regulator n=1 Tax=Actinomyces lilanjuaniae TaxID=2321394 RepID=A0ABM6Z4N8_9ACTO|nr:TetR/AcrR family transcriptional regulator [Actinomyces lilanjuaniae]
MSSQRRVDPSACAAEAKWKVTAGSSGSSCGVIGCGGSCLLRRGAGAGCWRRGCVVLLLVACPCGLRQAQGVWDVARPRADLGEDSARNRIKDAFWGILSQRPYADVTIKRLAREARVNHKTIYYHYANVDDLAEQLFRENQAEADVSLLVGRLILDEDEEVSVLLSSPQVRASLRRGWLYARGDSPYLLSIFRRHVMRAWLDYAGVSREELSEEELFDIDFVVHGLTASIGDSLASGRTEALAGLAHRELGRAVRAVMRRALVERHDQ